MTGLSSPAAWDAAPDGSSLWSLIQAADVEWCEVDERPDGTCTVTRSDGMAKVTFGKGRAVEPGQQDGGYDWTAYYLDDPDDDRSWTTGGGDWAEADEDMAAVLKCYLGSPRA